MARYKTIKIGGHSKLLHRHLMEQHLGRKLARWEQVHHINEDTLDNRIENLVVMTAKEHQAHHKQRHPLIKSCAVCGAEFTPAPTKRARKEACTPACGRKLGWMKRRGEYVSPPVAEAIVRANVGERAARSAA